MLSKRLHACVHVYKITPRASLGRLLLSATASAALCLPACLVEPSSLSVSWFVPARQAVAAAVVTNVAWPYGIYAAFHALPYGVWTRSWSDTMRAPADQRRCRPRLMSMFIILWYRRSTAIQCTRTVLCLVVFTVFIVDHSCFVRSEKNMSIQRPRLLLVSYFNSVLNGMS